MADFSHLKAYDVSPDREVPYRFDMIAGAPTIWCKPGNNANPAFLNETLRLAQERPRGPRATTKDTMEAARQEDREIIAKTCATRWDVKDSKGRPVEFSAQHCEEFFRALPNWIFDRFRAWVTEPANFAGSPDEQLGEP